MEPAAAVTLIAVVLVIVALVIYLVAVILELRKITAGLDAVTESVGGIVSKSEPVNGVVEAINKDLSRGTDLLEGLLDKKAGQDDAAGLVESLFPGVGASVLQRQGRTGEVKNIDEVYTRGALQLTRLGRESPLGAGPVSGAALRDPTNSSTAARTIYSHPGSPVAEEPGGPRHQPRSPAIGAEAREDGTSASDDSKESGR
jgi:uncharacterized protein YoxC